MSEETTQTTKSANAPTKDKGARGADEKQNTAQSGSHGRGDQPRVSRYGDPRNAQGRQQAQKGNGQRGRGGGRRGNERQRPEFDQKILSIRRVTRVVAGGRRFSFSVTLAAGDHKGSVGVGIGKASDIALAIEKAHRDAKQNAVKLRLTESGSIPYDVEAKYCSSRISLRPAPGKGIVAGSAVRVLLELAGVKDVSGKILSRSKNHLNNARSTLKAMEPFSSPRRVSEKQTDSQDNQHDQGKKRTPRGGQSKGANASK